MLGSVRSGYLGAVEVAAVGAREPPRPAVALIDAHIPQLDVHPHGSPTKPRWGQSGRGHKGTGGVGGGETAVAEPGAGTQRHLERSCPSGGSHTHTCTALHTRACTATCVCLPASPKMHTHACSLTCTHAHTCMHTYSCTHTRAHAHTAAQTRFPTCTHTQTQMHAHKYTSPFLPSLPPLTHLNSGLRSGFSP